MKLVNGTDTGWISTNLMLIFGSVQLKELLGVMQKT